MIPMRENEDVGGDGDDEDDEVVKLSPGTRK